MKQIYIPKRRVGIGDPELSAIEQCNNVVEFDDGTRMYIMGGIAVRKVVLPKRPIEKED